LLAVPLVVWIAYVATIGGDIFPAHRQLVCATVMLALATALGVEVVLRTRPAWRPIVWLALPALLAGAWVALVLDPVNRLAREERWEWQHQVLGTFLKTAFGAQQPLLAADAAGALPYFSELPAIDMLGINDYYLAHHRPANFGNGWLGHELGDGRYVIARKPDLVLFVLFEGGSRPFFSSDRDMVAHPDFYRCYRRVTFEGDDPFVFRSQLWVRAEDGRLGVMRSRDRVVVPGYLLGADPGSVAKLDHSGRAAVAVVDTVPAAIQGLRLDGGRWSVHLESTGGAAVAGVRMAADPAWRTAPERSAARARCATRRYARCGCGGRDGGARDGVRDATGARPRAGDEPAAALIALRRLLLVRAHRATSPREMAPSLRRLRHAYARL
jgi:hypothetical protein